MPHRRTFAPGIHALRSLGPACASASSLRLSAHAGSRGTGNLSQCLDRHIAGVILYPHETAYALSGIVITMPVWSQVYDPLGSQVLSTLVALLPLVVLLGLLAGAGFPALEAACIALIANTAPVAFGALGTPILTLARVTGLDEQAISSLAGRQLPFFSLVIPAWMVVVMAGWQGLAGVWPAVLVCGLSFATVQFAMANFVGPALVDVVGGVASLVVTAVFLRIWRPREIWRHAAIAENRTMAADHGAAADHDRAPVDSPGRIAWAWMPWTFLSIAVFFWGLPPVKARLDAVATPAEIRVPRLDGRVAKVPPASRALREIEPAVYRFNWLSAAGSGILAAALVSIPWLGVSWRRAAAIGLATLVRLGESLATVALMLALAFVTRYSGTDVTLGLALTRTGAAYAFFAPLLGWLGVALTGSDTSSNAMFGSLQRVTAEQLGLDPLLTCTANSTGAIAPGRLRARPRLGL
ncbi:hypothetical protein LBMAG47_20580 [Planctomycetia bacterium]|nr:hypothetical protein LBMAG47_20580 [Planctomycetia bacterium]